VSRRGWVLFVALGAVWGLPYLFIKIAVRELTPASLVLARTALGAAVLLPVLVRAPPDLRALLRRLRPIVAFTVIEMAVPWWLLSDAERHVTSSLAGLLMAAVPLVGALLSRFTGAHEPLGFRRFAGLLVGFAGVTALLGLDLGASGGLVIAELAVVVVCYAVGALVIGRYLGDVPPLAAITASLALCAVVYAPFGIAQLPATLPSREVLFAVVVLGVVCTSAAFLLFFALIAEIGAVRATVVTYVNPAVAVLAGVALLGEPLTAGTVVGFVLILAGSWLATGASARRT
jgi:drug/metabolite transporter (DMT)-like permease